MQPLNLDECVFSKISTEVLTLLKDGKKLRYSNWKIVIQKVVEYMIEILKDTSRKRATEIAKILSATYPETFCDVVGDQVSWGTGYESVRLEIYNAVLYKRNSQSKKKVDIE